MEILGIIIALIALFTSIYFSILGKKSSNQANELAKISKELSETQKVLAMLSILIPIVGDDQNAWRLLMRYLINKNKLPHFTDEDNEMLATLMSRLEIKVEISEGKIKEH